MKGRGPGQDPRLPGRQLVGSRDESHDAGELWRADKGLAGTRGAAGQAGTSAGVFEDQSGERGRRTLGRAPERAAQWVGGDERRDRGRASSPPTPGRKVAVNGGSGWAEGAGGRQQRAHKSN